MSISGCRRDLDEHGGYYDEETQTYKYVKPKQSRLTGSFQEVYAPRAGESQTVSGTVAQVNDNAKSVWIEIEDRKTYMILASSLSGNNRNDKNKWIQLHLSYVSPAASVRGSAAFREKWKKYVAQLLRSELLNQTVLAELHYQERSRLFYGNLYQTVKTKDGTHTRDINRWMIQKGLSFYIIERGRSPRDDDYVKAQESARKAKLGVWKY